MSSPKLWRGQTLRDRSAERRERFLAVGERLLGTGGVGAVTMRAVVREADLSPRYFYETFATREDLIAAVYDRVEDGLLERLRAVDVGAGLPATVRSACELCADYFAEDPGRARILLREPLGDDLLRRHSAGRVPAFLRAVVPMLGTEAAELVPESPADLAVTATALSGALISLYLDWTDGILAIRREDLADAAVAVCFALAAVGHRESDTSS
ncbi:TetR/AcrR family transcriptional regulator [Nocardia thailandica]